MLEAISEQRRGFCLLTSRVPVANLAPLPAVERLDVQPLSRESTRALLREFGVKGLPQDLEAAVCFCEGHPLLIGLLASRFAGLQDDSLLALAPLLRELQEEGRWTRDDPGVTRLLRSYARQLAGTPELALLHLSAVFDRLPEEDGLLILLRNLRRLSGHLLTWESLSPGALAGGGGEAASARPCARGGYLWHSRARDAPAGARILCRPIRA